MCCFFPSKFVQLHSNLLQEVILLTPFILLVSIGATHGVNMLLYQAVFYLFWPIVFWSIFLTPLHITKGYNLQEVNTFWVQNDGRARENTEFEKHELQFPVFMN